jgi:hypothetical protein
VPQAKYDFMKKAIDHTLRDDMRPEYDFSSMQGGVRGKYYERYRKGTNAVLLDPDVAAAFPTEDAVNKALRGILSTTRAVRRTRSLAERSLGSGEHKRRRASRKG